MWAWCTCACLSARQYGAFFYAYGVYLHWGYELPWLSAHNGVINTSFHHHCHHAKSFLGKPYHTGARGGSEHAVATRRLLHRVP